MALYEKLTATSTPGEIAAAYKEFTGMVGGDTQDAQTRAVDYLTGLGIGSSTIGQAYDQFLNPVAAPLSMGSIADTTGVDVSGVGADAGLGSTYGGLTSQSTPKDIASAYSQFADSVGGDTQEARTQAIDYLTGLGISAPTIQQAYQEYRSPLALMESSASNSGAGTASSTAWLAPTLQAIQTLGNNDEYGSVTFYNPNDGKTYGSQAEADAANAAIVNDSKKTALTGAWEEAQASNDYTRLANILADTNTTGYDLNTMFGLTPAQQSEIAQLTGYDLTPNTLTDYRGRTYDTTAVLNLANQLAGIADTSALSGGVFGVTKGSVGFDYDQAARALGRDLSVGEQVLLDSARSLIDQGITDLSKLSMGDIKSSVTVQNELDESGNATGRYFASIPTGTDSEGNTSYTTRLLTPEEAARIRTEEVTGTGDDSGSYTRRLLDDVVTGRGVVYDGKGRIAGSTLDAGSTYTGKGGTSYQITYDDQGKPRFTTTGFSTNSLGTIAPLLQIASFIPGVAPFAMAANAAIAASQGNVFGALASLAGMGGYTNLATGLNVANAVNNKDVGALAGALLSNPTIAGAAANTMLTDTISFADLGNAANLAVNIDNKNWTGALSSVASLTGSSDARVAASALTIATELGKDNPNFSAILNAAQTIQNTTSSASRNVNADVVGGITNRVVDDVSTLGDLGTSAYVAAINAGATPEEALAAANTVTDNLSSGTGTTGSSGVVINKIDAGGPNLSTTTTYDPRAATVDTNFGDLQGAIETNAMNDAVRADKLNLISQTPKFSDAYSQARELLGPNQTFTWNGKQYSTATAEERPDLTGKPKVAAATDESAAETARLTAKNAELAASNKVESTGFFKNLYNDLNSRLKLQGEGAVEYLKNNPNSPITNSVSTALEAAGELSKNIIGGTALFFDNKPVADAVVKSGDALIKLGQSVGTGPQDTKNWNDTINLVDKAQGWEKLGVVAGRILDGTSGLGRQVELELRQELPALFLGGGSVKGILVASGLVDTADTGGNAVLDAYQEDIDKGGNHQSAMAAGRKAGVAAAGTEAAIQLTLGKLGDLAAGKLDNLLAKGTTKIGSEGVVEGSQEAGASAAVDLALGNAIDVNKALTQGVAGAFIGKGTATATSGVDAAQTESISNNISTAVASNNPETVNSAITNSVQTSLSSGASVDVAVGETVGAAITNGADPVTSINNAVSTAIESGADTSQVVASTITSAANTGASIDTAVAASVSSAVKAGADVNSVVAAATEAANSTGNNVSITSDANVVTINNATTNTNTTVDVASGVTTSVNNNTGVTTVVDANTNTTTTVDANTNTTTQTNVNTNTNVTTNTTVNTNTNVTTQTTTNTNTNTQTTVITDTDTNTQTTINVNTDTGEVIDEKETTIPDDWKPPVIDVPVVPQLVTPGPAQQPLKLQPRLPQQPRTGAGGVGLPVGMDVNPASLRSRVTQGAIDPLARVKEIQAEFERDAMIQNVDPRLLQILQQRSDPQQQAQQFDKDIGALAKMLRGESDTPSNEGKYYSYGSEDSIDDILGGRAANYKEGGFVEPLKASGGSMALPLLVKSGGALGHYKGRENFKEGKHVAGEGDGQSDDIPAWLADGEFVFPADVVSALGNGSTKAGTDKLYEMMHNIRDRARSKGPKDLPPPALKSPLDYLKSSKRSTT